MKFNSSLYLKWIEITDKAFAGADFTLVNSCALAFKDKLGRVVALTIFEPKDLTDAFVKRFEIRKNKSEFSAFTLYLPLALQQCAETCFNVSEMKNFEIVYTPVIKVQHGGDAFHIQSKIKILNICDSSEVLKSVNQTLQEISIVDDVVQASDPLSAIEVIRKHKPDIIILDIQLRERVGVNVLKTLIKLQHYPLVIMSSLELDEGTLVYETLNAGAFDYIQNPGLKNIQSFKKDFEHMALFAIESKCVRTEPQKSDVDDKVVESPNISYPDNLIWALGASTGGTEALKKVLLSLPTKIPPILIVQHLPLNFSRAFAAALNEICPFTVKEAVHGEPINSDHVYIAPSGMHMGVEKRMAMLYVSLKDSPPINSFKPSIDYLFFEIAKLRRCNVVAGLLTGMGSDGARGLLALKQNGAQTFTQDEESSVIYGMPRVAYKIGASDQVVHLNKIAEMLLQSSLLFKKVG